MPERVRTVSPTRSERLDPLTAISPIDGRYHPLTKELSPFFSEAGLIRTRVEVEARYLIALSHAGVIRQLDDIEEDALIRIGPRMTMSKVKKVKEIEEETRHDVKSMERVFREMVAGTSLEDLTEMIHFGLTSEDVNNLAYRLMLDRGSRGVVLPKLKQLANGIADMAEEHAEIPMLARTHGQAAVPTTLGKELANFGVRLRRQIDKIAETKLSGKLNGAVGNFNAHQLARPDINWIEFSVGFIESLGLEPNVFTTQINPADDIVELLQAYQRASNIVIDLDQDMWRYISDGWFVQEVKKGEVGSSTMPQKVNPIDFENSEGNLGLANGLTEQLGRKLQISRLQRDLSDSTVMRNIGVVLAYQLIAYKNSMVGLGKLKPNAGEIGQALNENWAILTEGVQTLLRQAGVEDPYELVKSLSRGQKIGPKEWKVWVNNLPVPEDVKKKLLKLTPSNYLGKAVALTAMAVAEIRES